MIERYFHRWEQQLADVSKHERLVHPFEWGDDWIDEPMDKPEGLSKVSAWVDRVMQDTDAFSTPEPARYTFTTALPSVQASGEAGLLTYASGFTTPHESNNTVDAFCAFLFTRLDVSYRVCFRCAVHRLYCKRRVSAVPNLLRHDQSFELFRRCIHRRETLSKTYTINALFL